MKSDKTKIYLIDLFLILVLFFTLFASIIIDKWIIAIFLMLCLFTLKRSYRIKYKVNIYTKQVNIMMILFAIGYVIIHYLSGLYFGFTTSKVLLSFWSILKFIIPLIIIVVSSEYIRKLLLSQEAQIIIKGHKYNFHYLLVYIILVLVDLIVYTGIYDLSNFDDFLKILGLSIFASISANFTYHNISDKFSEKSVIAYRLITVLFLYIIPLTADMPLLFEAFYRTVYPFVIFQIIDFIYARKNDASKWRKKNGYSILSIVSIAILLQLVMLISCQFRYGIVVVGTESMTGSIDRGDAVIYEEYDGSDIKIGQVIMFEHKGLRTIHRVTKIIESNGEVRYYTKGDANLDEDQGYRVSGDIIGIIKLKVKYIGKPTLFFRSLFSN